MVCGPIHFYHNDHIKVFNEHQVNDYLYTLLSAMVLWFQTMGTVEAGEAAPVGAVGAEAERFRGAKTP